MYRANQAISGRLFWADWRSPAACIPSCSAGLDLHTLGRPQTCMATHPYVGNLPKTVSKVQNGQISWNVSQTKMALHKVTVLPTHVPITDSLVTLDYTQLYTYIPHAVLHYLDYRQSRPTCIVNIHRRTCTHDCSVYNQHCIELSTRVTKITRSVSMNIRRRTVPVSL